VKNRFICGENRIRDRPAEVRAKALANLLPCQLNSGDRLKLLASMMKNGLHTHQKGVEFANRLTLSRNLH